MYWKIEPYQTSDADYCVLPAETEKDHWEALEYAKARLEDRWDGLEFGEKATVTIQLCEGIMPESDYLGA